MFWFSSYSMSAPENATQISCLFSWWILYCIFLMKCACYPLHTWGYLLNRCKMRLILKNKNLKGSLCFWGVSIRYHATVQLQLYIKWLWLTRAWLICRCFLTFLQPAWLSFWPNILMIVHFLGRASEMMRMVHFMKNIILIS